MKTKKVNRMNADCGCSSLIKSPIYPGCTSIIAEKISEPKNLDNKLSSFIFSFSQT